MKKPAVALASLVILLLTSPVLGQTTGAVKGVVVGPDGQPLPGVSVEAKSPALQGVRDATTDREGRFSLSLLPPGTYTVKAELQGFGAKAQTLKLGLAQDLNVRFELVAVASESVSVSAEAATVETTSNSVGRDLDQKVFQALPTGRNYADVVQLNSGIGTDASDSRNTAITVYGATGLENAYLVDGVNTTGVEFGNQGKVLNFEFVQEVEFKSGGYEAEYGHAVGGILNVVTKSGGNDFHGDAFGYLNRDSLQANNKHTAEITAGGVPTGFSKSDYGLDLGGYFIKDRLWFFAAYDRVKNTQKTLVTTPGPDEGDITNLDTGSNLYSGKLTFHINDQNSVIGTVFGDPTTDNGAIGLAIGPPSTYVGTDTVGGTDFSLRYEGILSSQWLVTAQYGRHHEDVSTLPGPDGNQIAVQDLTGEIVSASGGFGGITGNGQFNDKKFTRSDYRLDVSHLLANHDLKGGFEFERVDANVVRSFSGGQLVQILGPVLQPETGDPRTVYAHIFFASTDSPVCCPPSPAGDIVSAPLVATPNHDLISAFLQDSWKVRPNLTVNAGVRYEKQLIRGLGNVTYIDIDHFSPRVGLSWDFLKDGKTKFFASYGQFVESVPLDMNIRSLNGERDATIFNFDPTSIAYDPAADTTNTSGTTPSAIKGTAVNDIAPNLKSQYQEEILIGVERQFGETWSVGLHGIYRSLRSVLEDTYIPQDTNYAFFNPGSSRTACNAGVCQDIFAYPHARRYFRGIELSAQKRLSDRWLLYASYLYSELKGNYDGGFREIGGFNAKDPNITDDFDYPEFAVNSSGKLVLDRPHQAKAQVAYVFPFGLTTALSGFYSSGSPLSRVGWWNGYGGPELFITPRGSEGRSPNVYEMDFHADYALTIRAVAIHFLADLFNLLNRQQITSVDQVWAFDQGDNSSPTPTNSHYGKANTWQQPRTLRLGLRVSF